MIYSYAELKGKIKIGATVRAVPGMHNPCGQLQDDGSDTAEITDVTELNFWIDGCYHTYIQKGFLEIIPTEITWDTLAVGDEVEHLGLKYRVLAVIDDLVALSYSQNHESFCTWQTKTAWKLAKYTIVQPQQLTPSKTTLSMDEIAKKFGVDVKDLEIKKE